MKGLIWVSTGFDEWGNFEMMKKSGMKTHILGQLYCKLQKEKGSIVEWLEDCLWCHRKYILLDPVSEAHYSNLEKEEYESATFYLPLQAAQRESIIYEKKISTLIPALYFPQNCRLVMSQ